MRRQVDNAAHIAVQPPQGPHILQLPFFSGPHFQEAPSENRTIGLITEGNTKEARGFAHKGIPRWSLSMIVIHVFTYPHAACPWIGHVK